MSDSNNSDAVLVVSIPKPYDLCFIEANLMGWQKSTKFSTKTQTHVVNCRQLILAEKEIMASPVIGRAQQVHIITSHKFYNEGKLEDLLSANNLYSSGYQSKPVSSEIYESCLQYTMQTRLSPSWNFVEPYLVQGKDFLTTTNPMNAVKLQIVVNENDAHIVVWPQRVKLPPFPLEDYMKMKKNLSNDPSNFYYDFSTSNERIFALPRMTQCKLETITSTIPCKTRYSFLKEFWKDKHGYCLPESDSNICYVTVRFFPTAKEMCYPYLCVRQNNLILLPPADHKSLLESFSSDLEGKLSNICLESQIGYTVVNQNAEIEIILYSNESSNKQSPEIQVTSSEQNWEEEEVQVVYDSSFRGDCPDLNNSMQNSTAEIQVEKEQIPELNLVNQINPENLDFMQVNQETFNLMMNSQISLIPTGSYDYSPTTSLLTPSIPTRVLTPVTMNENQIEGKRPAECIVYTPTEAKKRRSKPQIQENIDMEDYAKRGLLGQLNMATLQNFLRQNGVHYKRQDKKSDLIGIIMAFLNLLQGIPQGAN